MGLLMASGQVSDTPEPLHWTAARLPTVGAICSRLGMIVPAGVEGREAAVGERAARAAFGYVFADRADPVYRRYQHDLAWG